MSVLLSQPRYCFLGLLFKCDIIFHLLPVTHEKMILNTGKRFSIACQRYVIAKDVKQVGTKYQFDLKLNIVLFILHWFVVLLQPEQQWK